MTKIKCLICGDVLTGDGRGTFMQCKCKNIYIDETEYYCRVGFKDEENYKVIKDFKREKKKERVNSYEKERRKERSRNKSDKD
jgi:hypothetical protein